MASHKSAEKRARQTLVRTARNTARKSQVKTLVKAFKQVIAPPAPGSTPPDMSSQRELAQARLRTACRALRRAGSARILPQGTVNRRVSRLERAHHVWLSAAAA